MPTPRTLTLAAQSLRVNTRAPAQWLARVAMASVAFLALAVAWGSRGVRGAPGLWLFSWHAWTCLFLLAIGGAAFFPAAIAEEKEQRTLPLLRLAGCSPAAVLLGRATGDLLTVAALLVAQLPIAVLAITLGGIAPVQVWAAGLLLLALVLFVHGTGTLCAVVCGSVARATGVSVAVVLATLIVPPLLSLSAPAATVAGIPIRHLSALATLDAILATGFAGPALTPAAQAHAALGLLLDAAAWIVFRSQAGDGGAGAAATVRRAPIRHHDREAAVEWRDWQFLHGARRGMAIRVAAQVAMLLVVGTLVPARGGLNVAGGQGYALGSLAVVVFDLGISAARAFSEDLRCRTFEQMGTLPMASGDHVLARWRAFWRAQAPGLVALSLLTFVDFGFIGLFFGVWFLGPQLILLPCLTAWLTLKGWRGAFALAITAQLVCVGVAALLAETRLGCCVFFGAIPIPMFLAHKLRLRIQEQFRRALHG